MDAELTQALRSFEAGPDADGAARALRGSLRAGQPVPSVLAWLFDLGRWPGLGDDLQQLAARAAAAHLGPKEFRFVDLHTFRLGPTEQRVAVFEREGVRYSLVPGGEVTLGFAFDDYLPGEYQLRDIRRFADRVLGEERIDPERCLEIFEGLFAPGFGPVRTVRLSPLLAAQEAKPWSTWEGLDLSAGQGLRDARLGPLRLPSEDEWEHLCSGGSRALFRWGDHAPAVESPSGAQAFTDHRQPNAFGLRMPHDTYATELCQPMCLRGGDGGSLVCGGGTHYLPWLTLATAWGQTPTLLGDGGAELDVIEPGVRWVCAFP